ISPLTGTNGEIR
nr:RecName: Full=Peroxidase 2 [Vitis vinifera]